MRKSDWIWSFVLVAALFLIGCEKQESAPAPAAPATPSAAAPAPAPAIPPAPDEKAATAAGGAAATQAAEGASAEAQKLVDQALAYIKENKLDLAEKTVTQLEGMKASLTPALQKQVDNARSLLNTAKAAGAVKVPALPGASQ